MNRRLSALDGVMLMSNSDAHGLANLGREANVFDLPELSYAAIADVFRKRQRNRFMYTIEFFPEQGKYHVDGHRDCNYFCGPEEAARQGGTCPKCGKDLVRGVLGRVHALADRDGTGAESAIAASHVPYRRIVPLEETIGSALGVGKSSKKVNVAWRSVVQKIGPEFYVLLDAPLEEIASASSARIAEAVRCVREGKLFIRPGYDGVYGTVDIFGREMERAAAAQDRLLL